MKWHFHTWGTWETVYSGHILTMKDEPIGWSVVQKRTCLICGMTVTRTDKAYA